MKKLFLLIVFVAILLSLFYVTAFADEHFILNTESGKYHRTSCSYLPSPSKRERLDIEEIKSYENISPCKHCKPLEHSYDKKEDSLNIESDESNIFLNILEGVLSFITGAISFIIIIASGYEAYDIMSDSRGIFKYRDFSMRLGFCCFVFLALSSILVFRVIFTQGIFAIADDYFKWCFVPFYITLPSTALWCFIAKYNIFD